MKKVSILIPIYNQENLIVKCLDSIPPRKNIEILIVDDASTDNSRKVITDYAIKHKDKNISMIINKENLGIGLTRNVLLENAEGKYIFFLDSDDFIYSEAFLEVMDNDLKYDIIENIHRRNDGHEWYCHVYRGTFIKTDLAKTVAFKDMKAGEDTEWKRDFNKQYPNATKFKSDLVVYHYNSPRPGSLTDQNRNKSISQTMFDMFRRV